MKVTKLLYGMCPRDRPLRNWFLGLYDSLVIIIKFSKIVGVLHRRPSYCIHQQVLVNFGILILCFIVLLMHTCFCFVLLLYVCPKVHSIALNFIFWFVETKTWIRNALGICPLANWCMISNKVTDWFGIESKTDRTASEH